MRQNFSYAICGGGIVQVKILRILKKCNTKKDMNKSFVRQKAMGEINEFGLNQQNASSQPVIFVSVSRVAWWIFSCSN